MDKKIIYTIGYTLFQQDNTIDVEGLFRTLAALNIDYLIDVRSVPFSKQYPQCNADNLKVAGRELGIHYAHFPELGAKAESHQEVFSIASEIFFEEEVFPIAKSNRPEKTELNATDEIVDFRKFRTDENFVDGLKRIENAYDQELKLCLMCSERKPMDCHRYFLISKALEQRYGEWLEVRHVMGHKDGKPLCLSNVELDKQLEEFVRETKNLLPPLDSMFIDEILDNYFGSTAQEKVNDFCDRYWNLMHGWKRYNYNTNNYDETI